MKNLQYDQLLISSLMNKEEIHAESFDYQSIFLSSIKPDPTNGRFLPSILIDDKHAKQFITRKLTKMQLMNLYHGDNNILIGKSCIINCLPYGSTDWKRANQTIESIIELGENIAVSEMIQAPTIYPIENNQYQILTGHRRFFAIVYAKGYGSIAQFKLYKNKPLLIKVKQFQENASREDLPQYGKLQAFLNALTELDALNNAKLKAGLKKLTVKETATNLGISMGAFDNYNVLTRYSCVIKAYETNLNLPFVSVKKIVLTTEAAYKEQHNKTLLNINDKKIISDQINTKLMVDKPTPTSVKSFKMKPIQSSSALKMLLTCNVTELNTGIDWENIDWQNHAHVSKALTNLIEFLNSEAQ